MNKSNTSESLDIGKLREWIGREQETRDIITPRLMAEFNSCFDDAWSPGTAACAGIIPGLHWCLTPDTPALTSLDEDGHVARGEFLPPVPLPHRLWAGGRLEFFDALLVGDEVRRTSTVQDVTLKEGRSGPLCFVMVRHEFTTSRGPALTERQDIVYRDHSRNNGTTDLGKKNDDAAAGNESREKPVPVFTKSITAGPVFLFRYSALTFNGHRIHYDSDYCRAQGYPGLLIHGPLQATLLMRCAASIRDGETPHVFDYRAVRPLFAGTGFSINAAEHPGGLELWTEDAEGNTAMTARAGW